MFLDLIRNRFACTVKAFKDDSKEHPDLYYGTQLRNQLYSMFCEMKVPVIKRCNKFDDDIHYSMEAMIFTPREFVDFLSDWERESLANKSEFLQNLAILERRKIISKLDNGNVISNQYTLR